VDAYDLQVVMNAVFVQGSNPVLRPSPPSKSCAPLRYPVASYLHYNTAVSWSVTYYSEGSCPRAVAAANARDTERPPHLPNSHHDVHLRRRQRILPRSKSLRISALTRCQKEAAGYYVRRKVRLQLTTPYMLTKLLKSRPLRVATTVNEAEVRRTRGDF